MASLTPFSQGLPPIGAGFQTFQTWREAGALAQAHEFRESAKCALFFLSFLPA